MGTSCKSANTGGGYQKLKEKIYSLLSERLEDDIDCQKIALFVLQAYVDTLISYGIQT